MSDATTPKITLTDEQETAMAAIDAFMVDPRRQTFNLHGLAGSGKTTVLRHVASQYKHAVLCSLTGKAASVLRRKSGLNACTLHSFFYRLIEAKKDKRGRDDLRFERHHETGALYGNLVLLDESSMIPDSIGQDLLNTGAKVIACGDPGSCRWSKVNSSSAAPISPLPKSTGRHSIVQLFVRRMRCATAEAMPMTATVSASHRTAPMTIYAMRRSAVLDQSHQGSPERGYAGAYVASGNPGRNWRATGLPEERRSVRRLQWRRLYAPRAVHARRYRHDTGCRWRSGDDPVGDL